MKFLIDANIAEELAAECTRDAETCHSMEQNDLEELGEVQRAPSGELYSKRHERWVRALTPLSKGGEAVELPDDYGYTAFVERGLTIARLREQRDEARERARDLKDAILGKNEAVIDAVADYVEQPYRLQREGALTILRAIANALEIKDDCSH